MKRRIENPEENRAIFLDVHEPITDRIGRKWGMTQRYIDLLTEHKVQLLFVRDRRLFSEKGATNF